MARGRIPTLPKKQMGKRGSAESSGKGPLLTPQGSMWQEGGEEAEAQRARGAEGFSACRLIPRKHEGSSWFPEPQPLPCEFSAT